MIEMHNQLVWVFLRLIINRQNFCNQGRTTLFKCREHQYTSDIYVDIINYTIICRKKNPEVMLYN